MSTENELAAEAVVDMPVVETPPESPFSAMTVDLGAYAAQYITHAAQENTALGKPRAKSTMTEYRGAVRGFVQAAAGRALSTLPADFLLKEWLPTQADRRDSPVQLRIRVTAALKFAQWLRDQGLQVAPLDQFEVETPKKRTKMDPDFTGPAVVPAPEDVPRTNGVQAQPPPVTVEAPPAPVTLLPPLPVTRQPVPQAPQMPVVPLSTNANGKKARTNPLTGMFPSGYKLRVFREREMEDPVWVGDYPAERVAPYGSIAPFIAREVMAKYPPPGGVPEVNYLVCYADPKGNESERSRVSVAVPQGPTTAPGGGGVMTQQPGGSMSSSVGELSELLAVNRKAQEDLEQRLMSAMQNNNNTQQRREQERREWEHAQPRSGFVSLPSFPQPPLPSLAAPQREDNGLVQVMAETQRTVRDLAQMVGELTARLQSSEQARHEPPPISANTTATDQLALVKELAAAFKPPAATPPMTPESTISMLGALREIVEPSEAVVDTKPIMDKIEQLERKVDSGSDKRDDLLAFAEKAKALQSLFGGGGIFNPGANRPTPTFGETVANLAHTALANLDNIASAWERIVGAAAKARADAGVAGPPAAPAIPPALKKVIDDMLDAKDEQATVAATMAVFGVLQESQSTAPIVQKILGYVQAGKADELVAYMYDLLRRLGFGEKASPARVQAIVAALRTRFEQQVAAQQATEGTIPARQKPETAPLRRPGDVAPTAEEATASATTAYDPGGPDAEPEDEDEDEGEDEDGDVEVEEDVAPDPAA